MSEAIVGFILGLISALIIEWLKHRNEVSDRISYFKEQLKEALSKAEEQAAYYLTYAENLNNTPHEYHILQKKLNPELENILIPDNGFLYNAFRKKYSNIIDNQIYIKGIFSGLQYLSLHSKHTDKLYEYQKLDMRENEKRFFELRKQLLKDIRQTVSEIERIKEHYKVDDFRNILVNILNDYGSGMPKHISLDYVYNFLIEPTLNCIHELRNKSGAAIHLFEIAKEAEEYYRTIESISNNYSMQFSNQAAALQNAILALKSNAKRLALVEN